MSNIFVTSDLHFNHDKDFIYAVRGFSSIEEHDETIIHNWNEMVKEDDIVYILGDIMMGKDREGSIQKLSRLNGKLIILRGNHDTDSKYEDYLGCKNVDVENMKNNSYAMMIKSGKWSFYLSHYPTLLTGDIRGREKEVRKVCLHGHTHSKDKFEYACYSCYNVALDAHDNQPVNLEDIKKEMREKICELRDAVNAV